VNRDDVAPTWRAALVCLALALPASAAAPPEAAESPRVAIGVARFEAVGPVGATPPDVATLIADRIGTRGVHVVVGPAQLGAEADAEPSPERVRTWAAKAGVATIAVGRTTQIGGRQSIDVRLRAGSTGALLGTYVAEIANADQLAPALDRLAGQIVDASVEWLTGDVAAPAGRTESRPAVRGRALGSRDDPFGMSGIASDQPLSIHSDELEASQSGGARRLVFSKNVRVEQADLRLESRRLEAFYPENASQPERLVASGGVRVVQGTREARCETATYHRSDERLVCEGNAKLRDGDDSVAGSVIEFDLAAERVVVKGGAAVLFHPEPAAPVKASDGVSPPASGGAVP
jgi:lipopolysaccharide export system protein LptA